MPDSRGTQIDTEMTKINTKDFELSPLKLKIAKILEYHDIEVSVDSKLCRTLNCKCIATQNDFTHSHSNTIDTIHQENERRKENDVSNACLTLLRFLLLDGRDSISSNLELLYKESQKFLDKQRGPDETMIEVIYPTYVKLYDKKYRQLKKDSNYTDAFRYDQRIADVAIFSFQ